MSDDIPRTRRSDAEAADGDAAEVPAGGRGADTGAVSSARIDDTDRAPVQNVSSQNDIAGVGTRAADGSMESGDDLTRTPSQDLPRASASADADRATTDAEAAPSLAQQYEPGVDPAHARASRVAGPASNQGDPGRREDRRPDPVAPVADRAGSRAALIPALVVGVIAIVLFAFAIPVAPAIAWIGIALEVALGALIVANAFALREGRYRRLTLRVVMIAMIAVAIVFGGILIALGLAG